MGRTVRPEHPPVQGAPSRPAPGVEADDADVLVLGGGAAGLACAAELGEAGLRVLLLEARERLGGRIHTIHPGVVPYPIELGAEFVHGRPEILLDYLRAAGARPVPALADAWVAGAGGLRPAHDEGGAGERDSPWREVQGTRGRDETVAELGRRWRALHPDRAGAADELEGFVAGFHAADPGLMGVHALAHEIRAGEREGDEHSARPEPGYDLLVRYLQRRLGATVQVRTGIAATGLAWSAGSVRVSAVAASGRGEAVYLHAPRTVVTLPIGVLRSGTLTITPCPPGHAAALERLHMGEARRVVLCFRRRFWVEEGMLAPGADGSLDSMGFLRNPGGTPPVWWTHAPLDLPVLTGWLGGPVAARLTDWSTERVTAFALTGLASALRVPAALVERELVASFSHDWGADPWSRGAYSFAGVDGQPARKALATPVAATLYWAGEATYWEGSAGTVHGALATGVRAARELLSDVRGAE